MTLRERLMELADGEWGDCRDTQSFSRSGFRLLINAAARLALEDAAKVCEALDDAPLSPCHDCADAIRSRAREIDG